MLHSSFQSRKHIVCSVFAVSAPLHNKLCDLSYLKGFAWRHGSQTAFCSPALGSVSLPFHPDNKEKGCPCHHFLHCDLCTAPPQSSAFRIC